MKIDIHHYHYADPKFERKVDLLFETLATNMRQIMANIKDLVAEVAAEKTESASIKAAIVGLVAAVEANKADPAALDQVIADMKANMGDILSAIPQNTTPPPVETSQAPQ